MDEHHLPELSEPVRLGPFRLEQFLGRGGMGRVWRGVHARQLEPVAIKVLSPRRAQREEQRRRFRDEVHRLAQLHHPNIVTVLDFGEFPEDAARELEAQLPAGGHERFAIEVGSPYLVMEYCDGGTLRDGVGVLGWGPLRGALLDVLRALAHAHARDLIHRDIKPDNILFHASRRGRVPLAKLTDFGISLSMREDRGDTPPGIEGTLPYMAPEQFDEWRQHGPWTDLYALGCVAYQLVARRPPFHATTATAFAGLHRYEDPPPLNLPPSIPPQLADWVATLMEKDPRQRFASAADAAHALETLEQRAPPAGTGATLGAETRDVDQAVASATLDWASNPDAPDRAAGRGRDGGAAGSPAPSRPPAPRTWRGRQVPHPSLRLIGAGVGLYQWREVPVVGRDEERDRIWESLLEVVDGGRARMVLLHGSPGSGKTRLARWAAERARELGVCAESIDVRHSAIADPQHGLARALAVRLRCADLDGRAARRQLDASLVRLGMGDADELRTVADLVFPPAEPGPHAMAPSERHTALCRLFARLTLARPGLLLLDDVQWGAESLAFARALMAAQEESPVPLLVLATARDRELDDRLVERELIEALSAAPGVTRIPVPPLPPRDQEELVEGLLRLERDLVDEVIRRTDGTPLFAVQLVGDWVRRGVLQVGENGLTRAPGATEQIPDTIHELWQDRIGRVPSAQPPSGRRVLQVAAALGEVVAQREWVSACAACDAAIPPSLEEELRDARLAEPAPGGWSFCHGMMRESLQLDAQQEGVWAEVNLACVEMLRARASSRGAAERIGEHLLRAGRPEEAVEPLLEGALQRLEWSDYRRAGRLLEHVERILEAPGGAEDPRSGEARIARVRVHFGLGQFIEAARLAARTAKLARRHGWETVHHRALRYQAMTLHRQGELALAEPILVQAQAEAESAGDTLEVARCLEYRAILARLSGDSERAFDCGSRALRLFEQLDQRQGMASCLAEIGNTRVAFGELERGLRSLRSALPIFEDLGNRFGEARCRNTIGEVLRRTGDHDAAEEEYRRAQELCELIGSPEGLLARVNRGVLQIERGDHERALVILADALERAQRGGRRYVEAYVHAALLPCLAKAGRWDELDRHLEQAVQLVEETGAVDRDIACHVEMAADRAYDASERRRADRAYRLAVDQWEALGDAGEAARAEARIRDD